MNVAVLINQEHYKYFAKKLNKELNIDFIFICNPFSKKKESLDSIPAIYGFSQWRKFLKTQQRKQISIIIFDYVPIPIYLCTTIVKKIIPDSTINFIQHGIFEQKKKKEIFPIKTISWFVMTTYFLIFLIIWKKDLFFCLKLIRSYALEGGEKAVLLTKDYPPIDHSFFWDEFSKKRYEMLEVDEKRFINKYVIGSPDVVNFQYEKNGIVYYISQPLFKTGHCTKEQYILFLGELIQTLKKEQLSLRIILHPKINKSELVLPCELFYLKELNNTIYTEKLVGHFSSLLIRASSKVHIEQRDLGLESIRDPNATFYEDYLKNRNSNNTDFFGSIKERINKQNN